MTVYILLRIKSDRMKNVTDPALGRRKICGITLSFCYKCKSKSLHAQNFELVILYEKINLKKLKSSIIST